MNTPSEKEIKINESKCRLIILKALQIPPQKLPTLIFNINYYFEKHSRILFLRYP